MIPPSGGATKLKDRTNRVEVACERLVAVGTCPARSAGRRGSDHSATPEARRLSAGRLSGSIAAARRAAFIAAAGGPFRNRAGDLPAGGRGGAAQRPAHRVAVRAEEEAVNRIPIPGRLSVLPWGSRLIRRLPSGWDIMAALTATMKKSGLGSQSQGQSREFRWMSSTR